MRRLDAALNKDCFVAFYRPRGRVITRWAAPPTCVRTVYTLIHTGHCCGLYTKSVVAIRVEIYFALVQAESRESAWAAKDAARATTSFVIDLIGKVREGSRG